MSVSSPRSPFGKRISSDGSWTTMEKRLGSRTALSGADEDMFPLRRCAAGDKPTWMATTRGASEEPVAGRKSRFLSSTAAAVSTVMLLVVMPGTVPRSAAQEGDTETGESPEPGPSDGGVAGEASNTDALGDVPPPPGSYQTPVPPPSSAPPPTYPPPASGYPPTAAPYGAYAQPPPAPSRPPRPRARYSTAPEGLDPPPGVAVVEREITGLWLPGLIVFAVSWGVISPIVAAEWEDPVALIPIVGPLIANQEDELEGPLLLTIAETAGLALLIVGRLFTRKQWVHFEVAGNEVSVTPIAGTDRIGLLGTF